MTTPNPHRGETRAAYYARTGHEPPPADRAGDVWSDRPEGWVSPAGNASSTPPLVKSGALLDPAAVRARYEAFLSAMRQAGTAAGATARAAEGQEADAEEALDSARDAMAVAAIASAADIPALLAMVETPLPQDLAAIVARAKAATQGPYDMQASSRWESAAVHHRGEADDGCLLKVWGGDANAAHFAGLDPATVIGLCRRVAMAEAAQRDAERDSEQWRQRLTEIPALRSARDAADAEIAKLDAEIATMRRELDAERAATKAAQDAREDTEDALRVLAKAISAPLPVELDGIESLIVAATPGEDTGHSQSCGCKECSAVWARASRLVDARAALPAKAALLVSALRGAIADADAWYELAMSLGAERKDLRALATLLSEAMRLRDSVDEDVAAAATRVCDAVATFDALRLDAGSTP